MNTKEIQEQANKLRENILWNWPHLADYGKQMNIAADTMQAMLKENEKLDKELRKYWAAHVVLTKELKALKAQATPESTAPE